MNLSPTGPVPFTLLVLCDYSTDGLVEPAVKKRLTSVRKRITAGRIDDLTPDCWTHLHDWAAVAANNTSAHLRRINSGTDPTRCAGGHIAALDLVTDRDIAEQQANALLRVWGELKTKPKGFSEVHDRVHNDAAYTFDTARRDWWLANPAITRLAAALAPSGHLGHWITLPHLVDDLTELAPAEFVAQWVHQRHVADALVDRRGRWHTPTATCPCPLGERYLPFAARHDYIRKAADALYQLGPLDIAAAFTCHQLGTA